MVRFKARPDGKVLVPDEAVDIPEGQRFVVTLEPVEPRPTAESKVPRWLATAREVAKRMPDDLSTDLAEQHDHYIHGTPKR
jgi:hypothetical protein